jgi:hypothetical protein
MPKTAFLPVIITDAEKLNILAEVSISLTELEKLEAEKKRLPEAIKTLLGSIHLKNHALATGVIEREVEIREEPNAFAAKVKIFRVDTGEWVRDRDMDPEEAQMQLGNSSVPGPTPDNVRSMAEARERSEEQLAAATPEEAEALRADRLAAERAQRIEDALVNVTIVVVDREDGTFVARAEGSIPGLAGDAGLAGPIRETAEAARVDLVDEIRRLMVGSTSWDDVAVASAETQRLAEIDRLAAEQATDAAKGPKKMLRAPKGAKGKKLKIEGENGEPLPPSDPNGVDTTPPPGLGF